MPSPEDIDGKTVCSVDGSTPAQNIEEEYSDAELVTYDAYSKCVTDLQSGSVDAVTTDDAILRGYAAQYEGEFSVVGEPFTDEPYGVGLPQDDDALRDAVNDALEASMEDGTGQRHSNTPSVSSDVDSLRSIGTDPASHRFAMRPGGRRSPGRRPLEECEAS